MKSDINDDKSTIYGYKYIACASVVALGLTFGLTAVDLSFSVKAFVFTAIVAVYLSAFFLFYRLRKKQSFLPEEVKNENNLFDSETEEKLQILEQASEFFAATLKPADMFRLISGRIGELVPFENCALYLINEQRTQFTINQTLGTNASALKNLSILTSEGLAGKAFELKKPQLDENLSADAKVFSRDTLRDFKSAIAVPLSRGGEIFGVLQLFGSDAQSFDRNSLLLLDAIGTRIVPLLTGSQSVEKNLSSALRKQKQK